MYSSAQVNNDAVVSGGVLWEITKEGINHKSYLLGTFHGGTSYDIDYTYIDTLPKYKEIMSTVDMVGIECDINDTVFAKSQIKKFSDVFGKQIYPQYALLPDSITLSALYEDSTLYHYVDNYLQEFQQQKYVRPFKHNILKPMYTILLMGIFDQVKALKKHNKQPQKGKYIQMDRGILNHAQELNKQCIYMENGFYQVELSEAIQAALVESFTPKEQAEALYEMIRIEKGDTIYPTDSTEVMEKYQEKLMDLYRKDDLQGLYSARWEMEKVMSDIKCNDKYYEKQDELTAGRNKHWIPVMTSNLEKHSCLIAVGTLHLPGEEGLINLLRKEGFSLRPLNLYER